MAVRHTDGSSCWAAAAVSGLSILPSFAAVATQVGVGHAVVADVEVPVPVVFAVAGVAASLGLAWWRRRDLILVGVLLLVCLPALTGVVLALRLGISPTTYYPGKLLWHTAALGLTTVAAVLALAWQRLGARPSLGATFGRALIGATARALRAGRRHRTLRGLPRQPGPRSTPTPCWPWSRPPEPTAPRWSGPTAPS